MIVNKKYVCIPLDICGVLGPDRCVQLDTHGSQRVKDII